MLTRNVAYLDGLVNDARGTLVGIVYGLGAVGAPPGAILVEAVRREQRIHLSGPVADCTMNDRT